MQAQDLLRSMVDYYASMRSYSDHGNVDARSQRRDRVTSTQFSTLYQKPSFFRFAFVRPHPHTPLNQAVTQHVIGFDGSNAYQIFKRYSGDVEVKSIDKLESAVAGASGISNGAAHTLAQLLLPGIGGISFLELRNIRFNDDVTVDGAPCYTVAAEHPTGDSHFELHIERECLLLRPSMWETEAFRFDESRMNIRVNEPIESALFAAALRDLAA
jgi:hypothetical protein